MSEYLAKAELLNAKLETLTNEIYCLEEALEYVQINSCDSEDHMGKLLSGVLRMLLMQTHKISVDSVEVELIAAELAN